MALLSAMAAVRCTRLTIPASVLTPQPRDIFKNFSTAHVRLPLSSPMSSLPMPALSSSPALNRNSTLLSRCYATGSHSGSLHWSMERYVSVTLLTLVPAAVMFPSSAVVNYGLAVAIPIHGHWGLQQVVTDYVHGPTMITISNILLYAVSMGTCLGLLYLNYHDVGVAKAVAKLWSL